MATQKLFTLKSYFNFIYESFPADFVKRTMMKVCSFIWVLTCNLALSLFRHLIKHLAGPQIDDVHENNFDKNLVFTEHEERIFRSSDASDCSNFDGFIEEEKSELTFGFQFQLKEEDSISYKGVTDANSEKTEDVFMENELVTTTNTSKYEFVYVQDFGGFVEQPETVNFTVHEVFMDDGLKEDYFIIKEKRKSQNFDQLEIQQEAKFADEHKELNAKLTLLSNVNIDDIMETEVSSDQILQSVDLSNINSINPEENEAKSEEFDTDRSGCVDVEELQVKIELNLGENGGLKKEQDNWLGEFFMRDDSLSYGFDSNQEFDSDSLDHHTPESSDSGDGFISISPQNVDSVNEQEPEILIPHVLEEIDDDYIEFEPNLEKDPILENSMESENKQIENTEFEEQNKVKSRELDLDFDLNSDEEDEADVLLEHQELIGQMKMELKNARTGGLPTILEECETPRMKDDLKPLKINEKLEHRDQMAEIQKFYKSYTEKMRKLDVLNYQTLQAINFLRMKHPDQLNTGENTSLSAIKSVILPSLWPCKLRRIYADPTLKTISELHKDLEIVYVGQSCLSWEILHWQYKKAKEMQLYDPQNYRSYNQIAIEFQQFHVLLRRFTEDEMFQGPRVLNYTKQRCTLKALLQVPAIKDDSLKEKKARKEDEEEAVSILTMAKMIKESMAVFWEFLHTDKDTTNLFLTIILQGSKAHLQNPADSDLFMEIKNIHQKKEKKLKDMLRTGNCIVKKFQKHQETILDQHMFISQVELKLVSRVLSLPRLTRDQLIWCENKLNNIKFIDRKVLVEDSLFLLFPC